MSVRQDVLLYVWWYRHKLATIGCRLNQIRIVTFFESHSCIGVIILRFRIWLTSAPYKQLSVGQKVLSFNVIVVWMCRRLRNALISKYRLMIVHLVLIWAMMHACCPTRQESGARWLFIVRWHLTNVVHHLMFNLFLFLWLFNQFNSGFRVLFCGRREHGYYFFVVFSVILLKLELFRLLLNLSWIFWTFQV